MIRAKSGPHDVSILRSEIQLHIAELDIAELRRRSEQLAPIENSTATGGGPPLPKRTCHDRTCPVAGLRDWYPGGTAALARRQLAAIEKAAIYGGGFLE
jgi:hypothetical protein